MLIRLIAPIALVFAAISPACAQEPADSTPPAEAPAAPEVTIFQLPDGARPHDAAPAPDGKIWYTAQRQGAIGIIDPETGEIRQVPLGEGSAPHGVIQGPDGAAWITDGGHNAIVRFDPETEEVEVWPLPEDTGEANLNTAAFDGDGTLWFTGQNGIYGRFDPATEEMDVWQDPEGRGPYGIAATPDGEIYYVSLAGSHIGQIDRASGAVEMIEPPEPGVGTRRIWASSNGDLWVSEWNGGKLSRYRPSDGSWQSWRLAGEEPRAYAVYVDERDIVWVSDFGGNITLAFDPETEEWIGIPGSGEGANVRQILGRPGEVYLPESGLDRLVLVRYGSGE